jgi:hypothetical protein
MLSTVAYTTRRADGNYRIDALTVRNLLPLTEQTILRPRMICWDQSGWSGRASDATPLARWALTAPMLMPIAQAAFCSDRPI